MNILFFCRLFYPHIGGVEKHVLEISKILVKKGHKVTVLTEQYDKNLGLKESVSGIEVLRIPNLKENWFKKFKIWFWLFKNQNLIKNADIIHCHDVFFWYLPFRLIYFNKPVYTTFHGYEGYPLKWKNIAMHKISEKLSNGNICIGDFIKKWYGTKPTYITYGGVKISNLKSQISNKIKKESALFIGRLDEQTGIKTYVDAVKLIRKKIPNFKFAIIGDGLFRKGIEKDFEVLGFQKNPEKYFKKYNFAFASRYLSILEAMAARKFIFAVYDNPLKKDYLKMAAFSKFIVLASSPLDIVRKLLFYLDNLKEKDKIVESAYNWVKENSWNNVVSVYLTLWKK